MEELTIWLRVAQNLKSLEIEWKCLVWVTEKICGMNSFSEFVFSLLLFSGETIIVNDFSQVSLWFCFYVAVAPLIFCFDLNSTKILSTSFFLRQFHCIFNTFYFTYNFKWNFVCFFCVFQRYYIILLLVKTITAITF